jgi:hypothetical protein
VSLLEFKAISIHRGNAVAIAEQLRRMEKVPKREFIRGDQPNTLEKMPQGADASVEVGKNTDGSSVMGVGVES